MQKKLNEVKLMGRRIKLKASTKRKLARIGKDLISILRVGFRRHFLELALDLAEKKVDELVFDDKYPKISAAVAEDVKRGVRELAKKI